MQCQFMGSRSALMRRWHGFRCPECRAAKSADAILARGIERLAAEPAPADGLASAITTFCAAPSTRSSHGRRWRALLRHRLFPAGTFTVLTTLGAAGWLLYIDADPNFTIPTPTTPSPTPNAYNILLEAARAMPREENRAVAGAGKVPTLPASDRVAIALENTPGGILPSEQVAPTGITATPQGVSAYSYIKADQRRYSLADKEALLREYAPALALVRKGFAYPYQAPPVRSWNTPLGYLKDEQQLANVLRLEAQVKTERGDYATAVSSTLDTMELGTQMARGSTLIGEQAGAACEATGRASLWKLADRLDASHARAAARRMEHIIQLQVPFADTLTEDKWAGLAGIQELFQYPNWRMQFATEPSGAQSDFGGGLTGYLTLLPFSKGRIWSDYARLMDQSIADARRPYGQFASINRDDNPTRRTDRILEKEASRDPVVARNFPVIGYARFYEIAGSETQNALLATELALRAYRQDHQTYPKQLQDLVPGYLAAVPIDPFGNGQPLGYRYNHQKPLSVDGGQHWYLQLYSIGPDGKDDGGTPIRTSERYKFGNSGGSRPKGKVIWNYSIWPDSQGDIIAGLNTIVTK